MRLLLDTHVAVWWLADDPTLSDEVKELLDEEPDVFLSPVSLWEVSIKQSLGKIVGPADLTERLRAAEFLELPIRHDHALAVGRLPMVHRDPFDRMLVAQAMREDMTLVTRDAFIQQYDVTVLPA